MLSSTTDALREKRAKFAREVEYIKETAKDDVIDHRVEAAESLFVREKVEELEEAVSMVNRLGIDDEIAIESVEINKLLNAEEDMSFNEMVGLE